MRSSLALQRFHLKFLIIVISRNNIYFLGLGIVVSCRPSWVHLHVQLPLLPSLEQIQNEPTHVGGLHLPVHNIWLVPPSWERATEIIKTWTKKFKLQSSHLSAQYLVDGSALLQRTLSHNLGSHFLQNKKFRNGKKKVKVGSHLHVQHKSIERFLDMRFLFILFAGWIL